ncbi:MAG TPA: hypothetical protein PK530_07675 [Anaerolineales bacterium]|nr:hypothetical protein [Anaerolineales bacterium]
MNKIKSLYFVSLLLIVVILFVSGLSQMSDTARAGGSFYSYLPMILKPCWPSETPAGALPNQPPPVFCNIETNGPDTSEPGANAWLDSFDHGLSMASFEGTNYLVFDTQGNIRESMHWRHANHWMVDVAPHEENEPPGFGVGGAVMRPDQSFTFENGKLIVETEFAAGITGYGANVWGEIDISNAPAPLGYARDGIYGYDLFPGYWTLGCRFSASREPVCALKDDSGDIATGDPSVRVWEMSYFQWVGTEVFGGFPLNGLENYWRVCENENPDIVCRDRFRLELTQTSLTLYVNGIKYFEQTGIPPLPDALVNEPVYVYFASIDWTHPADTIRYHWDYMTVNTTLPPSAAPGFGTSNADILRQLAQSDVCGVGMAKRLMKEAREVGLRGN